MRWMPNFLIEFSYAIIVLYLSPFVVEKYNFDCYLHQDNDKKHPARIDQKLYTDLGII